jgi:transposase
MNLRIQKLDDSKVGEYLTQFQREMFEARLSEDLPNSHLKRIRIMLLADEGKTQKQICQFLGCSSSMVRHWMQVARSGTAHQYWQESLGRPKVVTDTYIERLKELIVNSPRCYGYNFSRWTTNFLCKHLNTEFDIELSDSHFKRLLKSLNLSTKQKKSVATNSKQGRIFLRDLKGETEALQSTSSLLLIKNLNK